MHMIFIQTLLFPLCNPCNSGHSTQLCQFTSRVEIGLLESLEKLIPTLDMKAPSEIQLHKSKLIFFHILRSLPPCGRHAMAKGRSRGCESLVRVWRETHRPSI